MTIIYNNIFPNKNQCKIYKFISFLLSEFIATIFMACIDIVFVGAVLRIFVCTVLVIFIDTLFMTYNFITHNYLIINNIFLQLQSHEICFTNVSALFICYIKYFKIYIFRFTRKFFFCRSVISSTTAQQNLNRYE